MWYLRVRLKTRYGPNDGHLTEIEGYPIFNWAPIHLKMPLLLGHPIVRYPYQSPLVGFIRVLRCLSPLFLGSKWRTSEISMGSLSETTTYWGRLFGGWFSLFIEAMIFSELAIQADVLAYVCPTFANEKHMTNHQKKQLTAAERREWGNHPIITVHSNPIPTFPSIPYEAPVRQKYGKAKCPQCGVLAESNSS